MAMERNYDCPKDLVIGQNAVPVALVGVHLGNTTSEKDKPEFAILQFLLVGDIPLNLCVSLEDLRDIGETIGRMEVRNPDLYN